MSLANAQQFIMDVEYDPDLKERIAASHWDINTIFDAAAERNLSFTERELEIALDQMWGVLSE